MAGLTTDASENRETNEATLRDDFAMSSKTLELIIKTKIAFLPATQKNLNVNVQSFEAKMGKWIDARNEMLKAEKEGIKVFDIK